MNLLNFDFVNLLIKQPSKQAPGSEKRYFNDKAIKSKEKVTANDRFKLKFCFPFLKI